MDDILVRMPSGRSNLNIVILDACRTNPYEKRYKDFQSGLAKGDSPRGTLIAYAAEPGKVARDGGSGGTLSIYTQALVDHIDQPYPNIIHMFQSVTDDVFDRSGGEQSPRYENSARLALEFSFRRLGAAIPTPVPTPPAQPTPYNESTPSDWKPKLVVPQDGTTISQPFLQPWPFKWDEPSLPNSVKGYNVRLFGRNAAYPLIDINTTTNEYVEPQSCSYIVDRNRGGWKWQVRAQFKDDSWGEWSQISTFDVSPFNQHLFCQRCPSRTDTCGGR